MTVAELLRWLPGLEPSCEQLIAMLYLERRGQRVCVDFGYANAIAKAREDWRKRKRKIISDRSARSEKF